MFWGKKLMFFPIHCRNFKRLHPGFKRFLFRPGVSVSHDALVEYECEQGWVRRHERPVQCKVGGIVPGAPECETGEPGPRAQPYYTLQAEQPRYEALISNELSVECSSPMFR